MAEEVSHYKILDQIGTGGLGDVYRARDMKLGRTVAIKAVGDDIGADPAARQSLAADARAAARLSHPNLATLFDVVDDENGLSLVFDYVPGEPLRTAIAGRPLNPRRAVDLAIQIADALADAHAEGVVHGDLKPDNIIITPKGAAKILDTGLWRWTRGGAARKAALRQTAVDPATLTGTLAYLSPEQASGRDPGPESDIFSLGAILFEMLTGRPAFTGADAHALISKIGQSGRPSVTVVNRALPGELDAILARAMAKNAGDRYESMATMAAELRSVAAILEVRATAAAQQARPIRTPAPRRARTALWTILTIAILAAAAAVWLVALRQH